MDKIIFFSPITEIFILVFVLGLGLSVSNIFFKNEEIKDNLSEIALIGFCLTLPVSQLINLFTPITQTVFLILSAFSFLIIFFKFQYLKNYEKWHGLNPAYHQSYLDLKKILNTDNSFSEIGSLKVYKKNKFWFISEK